MAFKSLVNNSTENDAGAFTTLHTAIYSEGVADKSRGDFEVTGTAGQSVNIAKGMAFIENDAYIYGTLNQKFWPVANDTSTNLTISPNASGSTRIDLVCIKLDDSVTAGNDGANAPSYVAVEGTPGAGAPATPDDHLALSQLNLVSGFSSIGSGDITDLRTQAKLKNDVYDEINLEQNKAVTGADTGGTQRNLAKVNASDVAEIGDSSLSDSVIKNKSSARMYLSNTQSNVPSPTTIEYDTVDFDNNSIVNTANNRFEVSTAGVYLVIASARLQGLSADQRYQINVVVNGIRDSFAIKHLGGNTSILSLEVSAIIELEASDEITFSTDNSTGSSFVDIIAGKDDTWASIALISSP